jgi:FkbM family methyltransferase
MPREILETADCLVDVGAHVGQWSKGMLLLTKTERLVAFEPIPQVFELLRENTRRFPQVSCIRKVVGDSSGKVTLNVESVTELSSVLPLTEQGRSYHRLRVPRMLKLEVPQTSLDAELGGCDQISVIKVDVQGYEAKVISGGQQALRRTRVLMVEVLYSRDYYLGALAFGDLYRLITSLLPMRLWAVSPPSFSNHGRPTYADAVFVNEELVGIV